MNSGGKRQRDFATCYSETKANELDFKRECYEAEREEKRRALLEEREEKAKERQNVLLLRLIEMGKPMEEIDEILSRYN